MSKAHSGSEGFHPITVFTKQSILALEHILSVVALVYRDVCRAYMVTYDLFQSHALTVMNKLV